MEQFTLKELVKRKLDETYIIIYAIKNEVNIKKAEIIEKTDVYTFIGIDIKGNRQFINIYQDKPLNKHFWIILQKIKPVLATGFDFRTFCCLLVQQRC